MLESIKTIDENLFLFLNSHHNPFFDQLMWILSDMILWIPLYLWFLWLVYKRFPKHFWTVIVAIGLMLTVSDQLCNLFKENIMRFRPTHEPHLQYIIHTVNGYRGGMYGFYSAHASNSFAVAFFIIGSIENQRKYLIPIALLYAVLASYSRIYLGVHYPTDVMMGALMGTLIGSGIAYIHNKIRSRYFASWV
jgi:undecaprenyl-diphosphatase